MGETFFPGLEKLLTRQHQETMAALRTMERHIHMKLDDIKQQVTDLQAKVAAQTAVDESIRTYVGGLKDQVTGLSNQLADAVAANDPAAMQAISDGLKTLGDAIDANAAAEAAIANTPAEPSP